MTHKAPGKSNRETISIVELTDMISDEEAARKWFESRIWPDGRTCPHCGGAETREVNEKNGMRYWCPECTGYFTVKTGTLMSKSPLSLRKWAVAIYLHLTSLKGVSSMKLHRDIKVTQKTAWFLLHRIRRAWTDGELEKFRGPVEVDEAYFGGREANKHEHKRTGNKSGVAGKTPVAAVKDRPTNRISAEVIENTESLTLNKVVADRTRETAKVYTDGGVGYAHLPREREKVNHTAGEYVRGQAHVNGVESFWSMLRRGYQGVYHKMSPKHLQRYVDEFAGRHCIRESDTAVQMNRVAFGLVGKRLTSAMLIRDNGMASGARAA